MAVTHQRLTKGPQRRSWVERSAPLPLPRLGQAGLVLAIATFTCVALVVAALTRSRGVSAFGVAFAAWALIYAGGLAWAWWHMRPDPEYPRRYYWLAALCLLQGLSYFGFWLVFALWEHDAGSFFSLSGWLAAATLIAFWIGGPAVGFLAPLAARGGGWMAGAQWFAVPVAWLFLASSF